MLVALQSSILWSFFSSLDDIDVWDLLKRNVNHKDRVLAYLCKGLVNRQLSRIIIGGPEVLASEPYRKAQKEVEKMVLTGEEKGYLLINGQETITAYSEAKSAIRFCCVMDRYCHFHNKLPYPYPKRSL